MQIQPELFGQSLEEMVRQNITDPARLARFQTREMLRGMRKADGTPMTGRNEFGDLIHWSPVIPPPAEEFQRALTRARQLLDQYSDARQFEETVRLWRSRGLTEELAAEWSAFYRHTYELSVAEAATRAGGVNRTAYARAVLMDVVAEMLSLGR